MKRTIRSQTFRPAGIRLGLLLLTLLATLLLASCADPVLDLPEDERAIALNERADEKLAKAKSYTLEANLQIEGASSGVAMKMDSRSERVVFGAGSDDFTLQDEHNVTIDVSGSKVTTRMTKGYQDGKMYRYTEQLGTVTQALWSPLSRGDYEAYEQEQDEEQLEVTAAFTPENCTVKTSVQQEDGSWLLTFSGFNEEGLSAFRDGFFGEDVMTFFPGYVMKDVTIRYLLTPEFYPQKFSVDVTFDEDTSLEARSQNLLGTIPAVLTYEATYSGYNETIAPQAVNLDSYTEVSDLRLLDRAEKAMKDIAERESGTISTQINQYVYRSPSQTNSASETDETTYGTDENGFYYTIRVNAGGTNYTIAYRDGKQTISVSGKTTSTTEQSETDARQYVKTLCNPGSFDASTVSNIQVYDNEILFTANESDTSAYDAILLQLGHVVNNREVFHRLTFDDEGNLQSYELDLTVSAQGNVYVESRIQTTYSTPEAD